MNRRLLGLVAVCVAVALATLAAQSLGEPGANDAARPGPHPVAVVNVVRIFNECLQIKDLNERMRHDADDYKAEATQRREAIEGRQSELAAFRAGTAEYETRRKELMRLNIEFRAWVDATEADLDRQKYDWTRIVYEKTIKLSEEAAKEKSYDVVLQVTDFKPEEMPDQTVQSLRASIQSRAVVYNVPEVEITDLVIQRMDAQYKQSGRPQQPPAKKP